MPRKRTGPLRVPDKNGNPGRPPGPKPFRRPRPPGTGNRKSWLWKAQLPPDHPEHDPACRQKYLACLAKQSASRAKAKLGVPWGWQRWDWDRHWERQMEKAKKVVEYMKQNDMVDLPEEAVSETDAGRAETALTYCVGVVLDTELPATVKLAAAKTVLDFCKAKPMQKSQVTVKSAEDWLNEVGKDADL